MSTSETMMKIALESPNEGEAMNSLRTLRKKGVKLEQLSGVTAEKPRVDGTSWNRAEVEKIATKFYHRGLAEGQEEVLAGIRSSNDLLKKNRELRARLDSAVNTGAVLMIITIASGAVGVIGWLL